MSSKIQLAHSFLTIATGIERQRKSNVSTTKCKTIRNDRKHESENVNLITDIRKPSRNNRIKVFKK